MTEFGSKILAIILVVAMLIGFAFVVVHALKSSFDESKYSVRRISIREGDTLYTYYYRYAREGERADEYISAIKKLNGMKTADIYANDSIYVYVAD